MAAFSRRFKKPFGHQEGVGLVTPDELHQLMVNLKGLGAFQLKTEVHTNHHLRYRLEVVDTNGAHIDVTIDDPHTSSQPHAARIIEATRNFVEEVAPIPPFVDPMLLPAQSGTLRIVSRPPARVWIDGVPLAGHTPINATRARAGKHTARLTTLDGLVSEDYEVSVEVGRLTSLDVTLSPPTGSPDREQDEPR